MSAHRATTQIKAADVAAVRAELEAWRQRQEIDPAHPEPGHGFAHRIDLDLAALREERPLRAAPATADEYVDALRAELIDLRDAPAR